MSRICAPGAAGPSCRGAVPQASAGFPAGHGGGVQRYSHRHGRPCAGALARTDSCALIHHAHVQSTRFARTPEQVCRNPGQADRRSRACPVRREYLRERKAIAPPKPAPRCRNRHRPVAPQPGAVWPGLRVLARYAAAIIGRRWHTGAGRTLAGHIAAQGGSFHEPAKCSRTDRLAQYLPGHSGGLPGQRTGAVRIPPRDLPPDTARDTTVSAAKTTRRTSPRTRENENGPFRGREPGGAGRAASAAS